MAEPKWDLPVWQPAGLTGLTHSATPVRCPASVASPHSPVEPHQRSSRSPARSQASPAESLRIHQRTKAENGRRTHTAIRIRFRLSDILTVVRVPEFCSNSQVFPARWRSPSTTPKNHDGIRASLIMDWIECYQAAASISDPHRHPRIPRQSANRLRLQLQQGAADSLRVPNYAVACCA